MGFRAEQCFFLQDCFCPAEICTFLQKHVVFGGHIAGTPEEFTGGFQDSRSKNASILSRDSESFLATKEGLKHFWGCFKNFLDGGNSALLIGF